MDDNLDILKQRWKELATRVEDLEQANRTLAEKLAHSKTTSLQERLAARISRMGWFALIMPLIAPLITFELDMPWWVALTYGVFGVIMSVISFILGEYVRAERLTELPVAEAITRATKIKLKQQQARNLGIVLGVVVLTMMAVMLPNGPEREIIIIGGSTGFVIGLAIGIRRCIINARIARELIKSLKN